MIKACKVVLKCVYHSIKHNIRLKASCCSHPFYSATLSVITLHFLQLLQKQDSATLDMERANKEIEMLRKQYEAISQELKEALQEAEVAKCRRDWAFQERDKIVAERESIR